MLKYTVFVSKLEYQIQLKISFAKIRNKFTRKDRHRQVFDPETYLDKIELIKYLYIALLWTIGLCMKFQVY